MNPEGRPFVSMRRPAAALGFRVHSGWAAMVALREPVAAPHLLLRRRIELAQRDIAGSTQPYHAAASKSLSDAQAYLERCACATAALARQAVVEAVLALAGHRVTGGCVLLSAAQPLPALAAIFASHALIHTAEGEFYRAALREACESAGLPVIGVREKDLEGDAARALRLSAAGLESVLARLGKIAGPPWRQDEKMAALAAWLTLSARA